MKPQKKDNMTTTNKLQLQLNNYTKEERDIIVEREGLIKHPTKKHLWKINGVYRWANMNAYQMGVWFTDYSNGVNGFTDRWVSTVPKQLEQALERGAMPVAEYKEAK